MSMREMDAAAIKRFENDLSGTTLDDIEFAISEAQDQIDEIEPWLEALHAYKRKLQADSAEALEK